MFDYSEFLNKEEPQGNILQKLAYWALKQKEKEKEVAKLTDELKKAVSSLEEISERIIPSLMDEANSLEHTTKDGLKIKVKEDIFGAIPASNPDPAFKWLEENNHSNLIKREFKIFFGKDEEKWAKKFEADLKKRKQEVRCEIKRSVHPQTLRAFIKEQLSEGVDVPLDTFGVFRKRSSKVEIG